MSSPLVRRGSLLAALLAMVAAGAAEAVVLSTSDGVIRNSLCVGFDCPNSPSFGDTTILMMENNTRIKFDDTSTAASFPRNDWEIEANSSVNGGASYLGINDCGESSQGGCATDLVFAIEAGARQSALYVESDGDVGIGTSNPVADIHVVTGNTPTLRLDQDGSAGFAPQVWDVAGNESNFFIRDATSGSTLPFRIQPGAPSNAVFIASGAGNVGMGTSSPSQPLHVRRTNGTARVFVQEASGTAAGRTLFHLENNGVTRFQVTNTAASNTWNFEAAGGTAFNIDKPGGGGVEFSLNDAGNLTITGNLIAANCVSGESCAPDYVFEPDYPLMPVAELAEFVAREKHLPNVPSAREMAGSVNVSRLQMTLLEKIEELVLYTVDLHRTVDELRDRLAALEGGGAAP